MKRIRVAGIFHELHWALMQKNMNRDRFCKYCGWNVDEPDLEVLSFFHEDCWKNYRKEGLSYPMPKYA